MKTIFFTSILFFNAAFHCSAQLDAIDKAGYTDKLSYRLGETVTFFTKHTVIIGGQTSFDLKDLSGNSLVPGVTVSGFSPNFQSGLPDLGNTTNPPWRDGFGYAPTNTWTVPNTLPSGYYLLDNKIPIIIKGDNTTADIVIVIPTNTINAYTASGGRSFYSNITPFTTTVSFLRPQSRANYSDCDNGFFAWQWLKTWAAAQSPPVNLNFISDMDLNDLTDGWDEIENAKLLIIPGHSEYWTRGARINFDRFVDAGKNALILSGNTKWVQVRYEDDAGNADGTMMTCYRGGNWCDPNITSNCFIEDTYSPNDLQLTYHWGQPNLKYSIIGSIGSDSWNGGYGNSSCSPCLGQSFSFANGGFRITHSSSPLFTGITFTTSIGNYPIIPLDNYSSSSNSDEFDGTLVIRDGNGQALDVNNQPIPDIGSGNLDYINQDPQLDLAALGFYRAEMVGYHRNTTRRYLNTTPTISGPQDWNNPNTNRQNSFCPFMVFQKTNTSGIIINVNSNRWCYNNNDDWTTNANIAIRPLITANMISLLYNNALSPSDPDYYVFSTPPPTSPYAELKPEYSNVTYLACEDGSIDITPTGIFLYNAYKVDNGWVRNNDHSGGNTPFMIEDNPFVSAAQIDNSCSHFQQLRLAQISGINNKQERSSDVELSFSLFPNPASDKFNIQIQPKNNSEKNISIFNSVNQEIYHKEKISDENMIIDLSSVSKGIYFVKVAIGNKFATKKIVII